MGSDDRRRAIGKVTSVSADRFVIEMLGGTDNFTVVGFDDVHYVARLGSFLMIPAQSEYVVAEVVGLREKDMASDGAGQFDKANSAKYLDVVPVGMLPATGAGKFRFGVSTFPSLYADALYALDGELDRIFDTETGAVASIGFEGADRVPSNATRFRNLGIGQSVVFEDYKVKVRIDDFFGGHVAVLGNTGSGKSCTVASVLQSLFEKPDEHHARGATFVVFDVNGEYHQAFGELPSKTDIGVNRVILDGTAKQGASACPTGIWISPNGNCYFRRARGPRRQSYAWRWGLQHCLALPVQFSSIIFAIISWRPASPSFCVTKPRQEQKIPASAAFCRGSRPHR